MRRREIRAHPSVDLAVSVGSVALPNPVMTAAGTAGHGAELSSYFDLSLLGAVVVKSLASYRWDGNPSPRLTPVAGGMLNSVGLQGPGVAGWVESELPELTRAGARVVVSLWGRKVEDFAAAARELRSRLAEQRAHPVVAVELNVSCPNTEDRSRMFAHSATATREAVEAAAECGFPLWVKLSPNTAELTAIADAALGGGADALVLVNTLVGLAIDTETRRPVLGGITGGLSGPALHTVALRAVYECRLAFPEAPLVGAGGVGDGDGALRMIMAGAHAVQVGTATFVDPRAPARVLSELARRLGELGAASVDDVRGAATLSLVKEHL